MSWSAKVGIGAGVLLLFWSAGVVRDYFDRSSPAHQSMEFQLKLFGSAVYEYRSATGRWPASVDDLAQTSLARKSRFWRQVATGYVFLWPKNWKPEPRANAGAPLLYDRAGLFNKMGRVWVCWGDLRTEHVRESDLRALLAKSGAAEP